MRTAYFRQVEWQSSGLVRGAFLPPPRLLLYFFLIAFVASCFLKALGTELRERSLVQGERSASQSQRIESSGFARDGAPPADTKQGK